MENFTCQNNQMELQSNPQKMPRVISLVALSATQKTLEKTGGNIGKTTVKDKGGCVPKKIVGIRL
tara:strand:+ start:1028 stop:1222 length:195 start_codon:yes stop_codon:yes gene_type:complete